MAGKAQPMSKMDVYVRKLPPAQRTVVEALRALVKTAAPEAREELKWGRPWYSTKRDVCSIAAAKDHVTLGFARGAELADPAGRLEGTGKDMRHIRIKGVGEVDAAVEALVRAAFKLDAGS
ncbi:MAG: DUF1801 domain-containing protein [Planctomycetota bacterium]|jgi:hypothetical protein